VTPSGQTGTVRVGILGDVGGWSHALERALVDLGCDPDLGTVPADLFVVQVGDLIHKGPDNAGCVALVDHMFQGGRWIQLMGNHEAQYLGGPFFWREELSDGCIAVLQRWRVDGQLALACAFDTVEYGPLLITHGGLVPSRWERLGGPIDVHAVARALDRELGADPAGALAAGSMLGLPGPPGVVWPDPVGELLVPWGHFPALPFSQVHGHASPYRWGANRWQEGMGALSSSVVRSVDLPRRRTTARWPDGRSIVGIDPGFGRRGPQVPLTPLVLHLASGGAPDPVPVG